MEGEINLKTGYAAGIMAVCAAVTAGLLAAPSAVLKSIPTATIVEAEKTEYTDDILLSGTIAKNAARDEVCVRTYVSEQDISKVAEGQRAEVTGAAFPDTVYMGMVEWISGTASAVQFGNVKKTAVEIRIKLDEPGEELKQGYTASVRLITSEPDIMTVVPYEAVEQDDGGEFVYILKNGRAEKLYIETGAELPEGVELKTELPEGGRIISLDSEVQEGMAVRLAEEGEND